MGVSAETHARTVEKRRHAAELRIAGWGFDAIARQMGVSLGTAHNWVMAAMRATTQEPSDELRRIELERLDRLQKAIWPAAMKGQWLAVDRVLNIMARRAQLVGLDKAPSFNLRLFLEEHCTRLATDTGLDKDELVALAGKIANGKS